MRAPITGIVLITEMTGNMHRMLDIAVVSSIAYIIANLLGSKPIYTSLLENILNKQTELEIKESAEKVLVTYVIPYDSPKFCPATYSWYSSADNTTLPIMQLMKS